jgi:ATP-dependent RNA helicase RhlE
MPVDRERKRELLSHLVRSRRIDQALVFTRTKHGANRLAEQLARDGISSTAIHGSKTQGQRVRALTAFKSNEVAVLVATDLAARGLDIESLPHVVNFELPLVPEDYVHRIGRTGRAGADGEAISLVCVDESGLLRDIEGLLRRPIPTEVVDGFAPDRSIRAQPIRQRSNHGSSALGAHRRPRGGQPRGGQPRRGQLEARQPRGWRPANGRPGRTNGRGDRGSLAL